MGLKTAIFNKHAIKYTKWPLLTACNSWIWPHFLIKQNPILLRKKAFSDGHSNCNINCWEISDFISCISFEHQCTNCSCKWQVAGCYMVPPWQQLDIRWSQLMLQSGGGCKAVGTLPPKKECHINVTWHFFWKYVSCSSDSPESHLLAVYTKQPPYALCMLKKWGRDQYFLGRINLRFWPWHGHVTFFFGR